MSALRRLLKSGPEPVHLGGKASTADSVYVQSMAAPDIAMDTSANGL